MTYSVFRDQDQLNRSKYGVESVNAVERNDLFFLYEKGDLNPLFSAVISELVSPDFIYQNMAQLDTESLEKLMLRAYDEEDNRGRWISDKSEFPKLILSTGEASLRISQIKEDLYFEYKFRKFGTAKPERRYGNIELTPKTILEINGQMSLF